jgi:hypothetical protein
MKNETQSSPELANRELAVREAFEHLGPLPWPPTCDKCSAELKEPGAVVLTPPNPLGRCTKGHLCVRCFDDFMTWLMGSGLKVP